MILLAGILFSILILAITIYVFYGSVKQKRLRKLFQTILNESANKPARETAAYKSIKILHRNKIVPSEPIRLNIQNPNELTIGYELLKAEMRYLLEALDAIRNQKNYLEALSPNKRSEILKFLQNCQDFLEKLIDFVPLNYRDRMELLRIAYQAPLKMYLSLPDENDHRELYFIPLFEIIDKTPTRTLILFP